MYIIIVDVPICTGAAFNIGRYNIVLYNYYVIICYFQMSVLC